MEPLLHFAIPFAFLALMKVRLRKALVLSLLALTPDLDALFRVHRSLSHSAVILSALMALIWLVARRRWLRAQIPLASLALFSHLIFDLFAGYTPILWPLTQTSVWVQAELRAHLGSGLEFSLNLRLLKESTRFYRFQSLDAPLFTSQGFIAALALLTPAITAKIKEYIETRHINLNIK